MYNPFKAKPIQIEEIVAFEIKNSQRRYLNLQAGFESAKAALEAEKNILERLHAQQQEYTKTSRFFPAGSGSGVDGRTSPSGVLADLPVIS